MHFPGCGSIIILAPVPGRSAVSPVSPVSGLTHIYPENTRRLEPFEIEKKKSGQIFFMRGSARFLLILSYMSKLPPDCLHKSFAVIGNDPCSAMSRAARKSEIFGLACFALWKTKGKSTYMQA